MSVATAKVPVAVATGVICMALGIGIGVGVMSVAGGKGKDNEAAAANPKEGGPGPDGAAKAPDGAGGKGGKGGGGFGGKGGGGFGGGGKGPNPKVQLAALVTKLDQLTKKPLAVELTPEQKKQVADILAGLDGKDELTEDEAKAKLDALLKVVEGQKETMEAAGYRWPGGGGGGGGGFGGGPGGFGKPAETPANPFKAGDNGDHLKSLRKTVGG